MPSISATATMATAYYYSTASWHSDAVAMQGEYGGGYSRMGMMSFSSLGSTLKNTKIKSIKLTVDIAAGLGGVSTRTLTFWSSNYQTIDKSIAGTKYNKAQLGVITGGEGGNDGTNTGTHTYTLSASSNTTLFNNLATYLSAGNTLFMIYNAETSNAAGYSYSYNYLRIGSASIVVEYENTYTINEYHYAAKEGGGWTQFKLNTYKVAPNSYHTPPLETPPATHTTEGSTYNVWSSDWSTRLVSNGKTGIDSYQVSRDVVSEVYYQFNGSRIYYNDNGEAAQCYVYYNDNGEAVKCYVYYNDNGTAILM